MTDVYLEMTDPKGYMRGWEGWDHKERKYSLSLVGSNESFLDVGCGGGIMYECMEKSGYIYGDDAEIKYKGVDYSEVFINACKEMYPKVKWEVQNALALKEKNKSWDVVYLRNMLENCPYYDVPINEGLRVAKRLLIITMWQPLMDVDCIIQLGDQTWGNRYSRKKFMKFIRELELPVTYRTIKVPSPTGGRQLNRFVFAIHKSGPY